MDSNWSSSFPSAPCGRLPNELLLYIKDLIPVSDLRTHVCFYHTCRTVAGFYGTDSEQAEFWRRSCLLSGINFMRKDSSYKDIAFECISRDGFCQHPQCGGSLLNWNAMQVERAMQLGNWDPEEGPCDQHFDWGEDMDEDALDAFPLPVGNRIFGSIGFAKKPRRIPLFKDPDDCFLHVEDANSLVLPPDRRVLSAHPIAYRSCATFPALSFFKVMYENAGEDEFLDVVEDLRNHDHSVLTVKDVTEFLRANMDRSLEVGQLIGLLRGPFNALRPKGPSILMSQLAKFSIMRGLWAPSRWDALEFDGMDEFGVHMKLTFSVLPRDLYMKELGEEKEPNYIQLLGLPEL